jgi:flagellar biosynthesis anti-sigma factor FlgM
MKINDNNPFEIARLTGTSPVQRVTPAFDLFAAYGAHAPIPGNDRASLSFQGQEIQRLVQQVREMPDIREDKVKALKEQIQNGTHQVPLEDLSEAMFRIAALDQG